jgi:hypothetical protein
MFHAPFAALIGGVGMCQRPNTTQMGSSQFLNVQHRDLFRPLLFLIGGVSS